MLSTLSSFLCKYVPLATFFFLAAAVRQLAGHSLHNPLYIDAAVEGSKRKGAVERVEETEPLLSSKKRNQTPSQLEQFCSVVPCKLRLVVLAACLLHYCRVILHFLHFYVCLSVRLSVCMYVCMHACMYVCMCM